MLWKTSTAFEKSTRKERRKKVFLEQRFKTIYCHRCLLNIHQAISFRGIVDVGVVVFLDFIASHFTCCFVVIIKVELQSRARDKKKQVTYLFGIMFYLLQLSKQNLCFIDLYHFTFIRLLVGFFFFLFFLCFFCAEKWELFPSIS